MMDDREQAMVKWEFDRFRERIDELEKRLATEIVRADAAEAEAERARAVEGELKIELHRARTRGLLRRLTGRLEDSALRVFDRHLEALCKPLAEKMVERLVEDAKGGRR